MCIDKFSSSKISNGLEPISHLEPGGIWAPWCLHLQDCSQQPGEGSLCLLLWPERTNMCPTQASQAIAAGSEVLPPHRWHNPWMSRGPAKVWLCGSASAAGHEPLWWRGGGRTPMEKIPCMFQSAADGGNSPAFLTHAKDFADPAGLRNLCSKLEEFGAVQGSPPSFASIPQQCVCLLNIVWV